MATHLTSDHTPDGGTHRGRELAELADGLAGVPADVVLLGDLNDGGPGPAAALGMRDAWVEAHGPADGTPTFDPTVNPLAAVSSLSGRAGRLDRVLMRGRAVRVGSARLTGTAPAADGLYPSDHYGVLADLLVPPAESTVDILAAEATARTALAWVPPTDLWPDLDRVRRRHDPQVDRWPPHVNLLFGFVPEADFDRAADLVAQAVADVPPFPARLRGVRSFTHAGGHTRWLDPAADDPTPWQALRAAVLARFPGCAGRAEGFTPHLTLGTDVDEATVTALLRAAGYPTRVGELALLSRRGDGPMRVRATVTLGTGAVRWTEPSTVDADHGADRGPAALAGLTAALADALPGAVVELTGSRRMGCAAPAADLDLVLIPPGGTGADRVAAALRTRRAADLIRPVTGARVPGLRMRVDGVPVDLAVVDPGAVPPGQAVARRTELGGAAATTLSAVTDAAAVRAAVGSRHAAFAALARTVKAWARARGLDSAPHGGMPGLAWAVLAARTARASTADGGALLRDFFATWAAWDWRDPVTLHPADVDADGAPPGRVDGAVTVLTPTAPVRSCTAQVGPGMRDLLTEELFTAWEQAQAGAFAVTPPPLHRRHAAWAVLTVTAADPVTFEALAGRVRGRMRALLTALEAAGVVDAHAWPRPFAAGTTSARYAVGLGRTPPDATALREATGPWLAGQVGVEISRVPGGEVPDPT